MLRGLRFQLTLLYILVALGLVALIGIGSYSLLKYYFQQETDLALQYKMATQLRAYDLIPPPELIQAEENWQEINTRQPLTSTKVRPTSVPLQKELEEEQGEEGGSRIQAVGIQPEPSENDLDDRYYGQLASIYVLPLDVNGQVVENTNLTRPPFTQDEQASQAAISSGHDLRTITLTNGTRVRLLTYFISNPGGPAILQLGRTLIDQDHVLNHFFLGLLILGSVSIVLLGLGSWYLSGRTMGPAQRAWDQQQAFISNASHELRTPLTLIKASAEVGLRNQPDDEQTELLQDILGESDYMNRLVDDLLLLSRLDSHRLKLVPEPVILSDLLQETVHQVEKLMAGKGIHLEVGPASGVIWADRTRLRQVFLILLDNALHFTPTGGTICMETVAKRKTHQIIISDNGIGIPPEHLPHLFERFYQVNPSNEAVTRSNGLGLSIAKRIITAQGGEIHIESKVGKGTRVILNMPASGDGLYLYR